MLSRAAVWLALVGLLRCEIAGCEGPPYFFATGQRTQTCERVIEGRALFLVCPDAEIIEAVTFASYGTPTGSCDTDGVDAFVKGVCHNARSVELVEGACLGKNSCNINAVNEVFGEPCYGTTKHLAVIVKCSSGRGGGNTGLHEARLVSGFMNAQFGGVMEVQNCPLVKAVPLLADKPLENARDIAGKVGFMATPSPQCTQVPTCR